MPLLSMLKRLALPGLVAISLLAIPASSVLAGPGCPDGKTMAGTEAVTKYVDANIITRKRRAASKMTRMHKKMAKKGYGVVNVAVYVENGDLQGFFVTYSRNNCM